MGRGSFFDYVFVRWGERNRLLVINILSGVAMGISVHDLVVAKIKVKEGWEKVREWVKVVEVVRVGKLKEEHKMEDYVRV